MALDKQYGNFDKQNPLATLWTGRCTVYEYQDVTDPFTKLTTQKEVAVLEDEPCRLSFKYEQATNMQNGAAVISQGVRLFIRPDVIINPGSTIEVTQHGHTYKYKGTSKPAIYCNHQQLVMELYDNEA